MSENNSGHLVNDKAGESGHISGAPADIRQESEPGGYREVLRIAIPLVLSTASITLTLFVDRVFLSWHSTVEVAAATPSSILHFTICSLFFGTAQYVNTIVAQHHGAGDRSACSRAVWQGLFFATLSAPIILALIPAGYAILAWAGHGPVLLALEREYFFILMAGGILLPFRGAAASFFSGRGKTRTVMWGNIYGNVVNIVLDYLLIFGHWGFPELGIRGAGIATAVSGAIPFAYWMAIFLSKRHQHRYQSRTELKWDPRLFGVLIRYGFPAGVQLCLDVASFTVFVLLVGRLGPVELAISNIVLAIEMLSFLPMIGMSIAASTLVGEYIGQGKPGVAEKSAYSALRLALGYMGLMAGLYIALPELFLSVFRSTAEDAVAFPVIVLKGTLILRLVAAYSLFDTLFLVFSGALKGAGDTQFAMWAHLLLAWVLFVPPVYVIIEVLDLGLVFAWLWGLVYSVLLGLTFWLRFRSGRWKEIGMLNGGGRASHN